MPCYKLPQRLPTAWVYMPKGIKTEFKLGKRRLDDHAQFTYQQASQSLVTLPRPNCLRSSLSYSTAAILSSQSASPGNPSTFSHARRTYAADICLCALPYMDS